jgi:spore coat protein CotF
MRDVLNQVGRIVAENEVLKRRCEELTKENAQLRHLLREQGRERDQEAIEQYFADIRQARADREAREAQR